MKTYFGKLKPIDDCFSNMVINENTENYWKIYDPETNTSIGFKTFYKKYFGSDDVFKIEEHKKSPYLVYVNIGKNVRRPVFKNWVVQVLDLRPFESSTEKLEEPKEVPVILNGLIEKWEGLFEYDE